MRIYFLISLLLFPLVNLAQNVGEEKLKLAESYEKGGEFRSALRLYEDLFFSNKNSQKYFDGLVRCSRALNQFTEIIPLINEYLEKHKTAENYSVYGEFLWRAGKTEEANKSWLLATDINPKNEQSYTTIADIQLSLRLFDKSITTYLKGREELNNTTVFSEQLSLLYMAKGEFNKSADEVIKLYEVTKNSALVQGRFSPLISQPEARKYINELLKRLSNSSNDLEYKRIYAWFLRSTGDFNEALEVSKELDSKLNARGYEVFSFGNNAMRDGQLDIARKAFEYIIDQGKNSPYVINALYGFARTLELKSFEIQNQTAKEIEEVISNYYKVTKEFPNTTYSDESNLRIATLYFEKLKEAKKSISILKEVVHKHSSQQIAAKSLILLGDIFLYTNDTGQASEYYSSAIINYKYIVPEESVRAKFKLAEVEYFKGNIDSSFVLFAELSTNSKSDIANDALEKISLVEQNKEKPEALKIFARAELSERQDDYAKAIKLFCLCSDSAQQTDIAERSLLRVSQIYIRSAKYDSARSILNSIFDKNPYTIYADIITLKLGDISKFEGNQEMSLKYYSELLSKYPRSIYAEEAREKIRNLRKQKI